MNRTAKARIFACLKGISSGGAIGETTDDTEATIAVARAILRDGDVRHTSVGRELLTCSKSVHPGVKSLSLSARLWLDSDARRAKVTW